MKKTLRKKIEKGLAWTIGFLVVFFVVTVMLNGGIKRDAANDEQKSMFNIAKEYMQEEQGGISPFWLERYDITVNSRKDIFKDHDNDGLDLKDEYKYLTNPLQADTDQDGYNDGEEVQNGFNPTGQGKLDMNKDGLSDVWEEQHGLDLAQMNAQLDPDDDGLTNLVEYEHGTDPNSADTDSDGFSDAQEIANGYDPVIAGGKRPKVDLFINKLGVASPVVLSTDASEEALLKDLDEGIIHYPKTAAPGQNGNMMLTGHSSNYAWNKGGYNYILKDLNNLEMGDEFSVSVTQSNGKSQEYTYRITEKFVSAPDDPRIFSGDSSPTATLVTCWPLNSNWKRLVVKADLLKG